MAIFQPRRRSDLNRRLDSMRLDVLCFERALASGAAEAASYSAGAPTMASEFGRWARIVEELHNGFVALQRGWERSDPMNQPTWINTASRTAIVVSSGDENTGQVTFGSPSNRNPKGPSFGALVSANETATLFDAVTATGEMIDVRETWVFLYDSREGFVYSELSKPILMPNAHIEDWQERILFPRFDTGANRFESLPDDGNPDQDFSFTIQRR